MTSKKDNENDIFQELYELILDEADGKKVQRKRPSQEHFEVTPTATDFLENEVLRLLKLNQFFGPKMNNLKEYSQLKNLIQKQEKELCSVKAELITKLENKDGPLQKQLAYLWDKTFG